MNWSMGDASEAIATLKEDIESIMQAMERERESARARARERERMRERERERRHGQSSSSPRRVLHDIKG